MGRRLLLSGCVRVTCRTGHGEATEAQNGAATGMNDAGLQLGSFPSSKLPDSSLASDLAGNGGASTRSRPRLCVIGPLVGVNRGYVTTQGEVMERQLRGAGYPMVSASGAANRYVRFADITATILLQRNAIDVILLQVYGGPSFVVEDAASRLAKH